MLTLPQTKVIDSTLSNIDREGFMGTRLCVSSATICMSVFALSAVLTTGLAKEPAPAESEIVKKLQRFDQLDFDAFSKQDWKLFDEIHCPDVVVIMPDGHEIHGIQPHREDIASMFESMPDLRVTSHPVSFGTETWTSSTPGRRTSADTLKPGEWTSTIGVMEGTFTKPMKIGDNTIAPNGKKLKLQVVTLAHWQNGCIAQENLFWDNAAYMQQLGIQP